MTRHMLIDASHPEETRVVIEENGHVQEYDFITAAKQQIKGNIYLAKVTRVEPSLQAVFVEYGGNRQGFLPFAEIHPDYYQIPVSDKEKLLKEVRESRSSERADEEAGDEEHREPRRPFRRRTRGRRVSTATGEETEQLATEAEFGEDGHTSNEGAFHEESAPADTSGDVVAEEAAPESDDKGKEPSSQGAEKDFDENTLSEPADEAIRDNVSEIAGETGDDELTAGESASEEAGEPKEEKLAEEEQAEEGENAVETFSEEEEVASSRKHFNFYKKYKVQEVIKRGQVVLVQAIKEERGNKGAAMTTYITLAGRYCVLMPNTTRSGGVSRKIGTSDDRKRLKALMESLEMSQGMSLIVRTAGAGRTKAEIKRDFDYLTRLWDGIREKTLSSIAPAMVHEESDIIKRSIRDLYDSTLDSVWVQGEEGYNHARTFMKMLMPSHVSHVKHYKGGTPIFYEYGVEEKLQSMNDPIVQLRSGGYLVINSTEALVAIDVNSGRATKERSIEETAYKTNMEAAEEVARQLRLRDLAGLLVIDFIDMMEGKNRRNVERALKDALRMDRAKIQVGRISPFGLLEMSRQRLRPSITEINMHACPYCEGRGRILSTESLALQITRALEKEAAEGIHQELIVNTLPEIGLYLLNNKRPMLLELEKIYGVKIRVAVDSRILPYGFVLTSGTGKVLGERTASAHTHDDDRSSRKRRSRRGGRDRDRNDRGDRDRNDRGDREDHRHRDAEPAQGESDAPREEREMSDDSPAGEEREGGA
ncbi:MAG: ribonuclease E/G, partial [Alphaproteobacteria bacterium]|nr:ribonuclease E/G [Alphaproteobacteria bacterium]